MLEMIKNMKIVPFGKIIRARVIAIPPEHGAWVFLFSPLLIGLFLGGFSRGSLPLIMLILAAFMIRQPITILVKILSGRRNKNDLHPALVWVVIYTLILIVSFIALILEGYYYITFLAVPALPVFALHLWLVSKRNERRQKWVEILASGVLALTAPAAYWVGKGAYLPMGWLIWTLSWLQAAGTILYAYLRLQQRQLKENPGPQVLQRMAREAFLYNGLLFVGILILAAVGWIPKLLPLPYLIQPLEVIWGTSHPAISTSPKAIGIRQLIVSTIFTLLFIVGWLV